VIVKIDAKLDLKPLEAKYKRLMFPGGKLQKFIDATVMKGIDPYIPYKFGVLRKSLILNTKIGSGMLEWKTPYARYLYYGKLMVDPITHKGAFTDGQGHFWSRPGVSKTLTDRDLVFNTYHNQRAGALWAERYKTDNLNSLSMMVRKEAGQLWKTT